MSFKSHGWVLGVTAVAGTVYATVGQGSGSMTGLPDLYGKIVHDVSLATMVVGGVMALRLSLRAGIDVIRIREEEKTKRERAQAAIAREAIKALKEVAGSHRPIGRGPEDDPETPPTKRPRKRATKLVDQPATPLGTAHEAPSNNAIHSQASTIINGTSFNGDSEMRVHGLIVAAAAGVAAGQATWILEPEAACGGSYCTVNAGGFHGDGNDIGLSTWKITLTGVTHARAVHLVLLQQMLAGGCIEHPDTVRLIVNISEVETVTRDFVDNLGSVLRSLRTEFGEVYCEVPVPETGVTRAPEDDLAVLPLAEVEWKPITTSREIFGDNGALCDTIAEC